MTQDPNKPNTKLPDQAASSASAKPAVASKKPKVSTPADRARLSKTKPARPLLLWLVVILLSGCVAGLAYFQWQAYTKAMALTSSQTGALKDLQLWQQKQQSLSITLDQLAADNTAKYNDIMAEQAVLLQNQERMDEALVSTLESVAKAQISSGNALPSWQLAEAEYLLRLANQRLAMEQASESAIALLTAADVIVKDSEQVGTYGIRRAIAMDLAALTAVPSVDVEGVYSKLEGLSLLASKLAFITPTVAKASKLQASPSQALDVLAAPQVEPTFIQAGLSTLKAASLSVWSELKQLIKVQNRAQSDQQLLTPGAELLVRMQIEMALSQTQVALLRRQQGIYDESLTNVKRLLGQYYRKDDAIAKAMLSQINDLEQVKVLAQLPDISGSLMALQGFIGAMHDRPQAQAAEN